MSQAWEVGGPEGLPRLRLRPPRPAPPATPGCPAPSFSNWKTSIHPSTPSPPPTRTSSIGWDGPCSLRGPALAFLLRAALFSMQDARRICGRWVRGFPSSANTQPAAATAPRPAASLPPAGAQWGAQQVQAQGPRWGGWAPACMSRDEISTCPCCCATGQLRNRRLCSGGRWRHSVPRGDATRPGFHGNAARRSWCSGSGISLPDFMGTGWWGPAVPRPQGGSHGHRHGAGHRTQQREPKAQACAPLGAGVGVRILRRDRTNGASAGRPLGQGTAAGAPPPASVSRC